MTELAAAGIPVTVTGRVLKLSRQPYYLWLAAPITASEVVEAYRANALFDAHKDDPEFGHRLLADEAREAGEGMSDRTAWRITSSNGWFSAFGKPKRGKHRRPGPPVHDDLCAVVSMGRVGSSGDNAAMESSLPSCRRTSSTAAPGPLVSNCGSQ